MGKYSEKVHDKVQREYQELCREAKRETIGGRYQEEYRSLLQGIEDQRRHAHRRRNVYVR